MKKLMLLIAAGSLWLFLAAIPVFADGGPHIADANSGVSTLTTDSCAGCHRAHTAQGQLLLVYPGSVNDFCLGCHGDGGTGATVDVETGQQYVLASGVRDLGTIVGATRAGGFVQARIGDPGRLTTDNTSAEGFKGKVTVAASAANVTSAHIAEASLNGLTRPGIAWGSGALASGAGATNMALECTSCHNPHGNNQYRILNPVPNAGTMAFASYDIASLDATNDTITTKTGNEFFAGDTIKITGVTGLCATSCTVVYVFNGITLKVGSFTGTPAANTPGFTATDITAGMVSGFTAGTIVRAKAIVTDAPLATTANPATGSGASIKYPERNYTVQQVKGTQGNPLTYLLYADNVIAARTAGSFNAITGTYNPTDGDYFHSQVPWNAASGSAQDAPNGQPATAWLGTVNSVAINTEAVAFNQQMTSWCVSCHTRYMGYQMPNPDGNSASRSATSRNIASVVNATGVFTTTAGHGFAPGETVAITGVAGLAAGNYVIATVPSSPCIVSSGVCGPSTFTLTTGSPTDGTWASGYPTAVRTVPAATSQYWFPRTGASIAIASVNGSGVITTGAAHGLVAADTAWIGGLASVGIADGEYTVAAGSTGTTLILTGVTTATGTSTGTVRKVDNTFEYQHSTRASRVCTTCHVAHGSNRVMGGTYSSAIPLPNGTVSASSRLLKVDNRGTCQMCHEPAGTYTAGRVNGDYQGAPSGVNGGSFSGGTPSINNTYTNVVLP